MYEYMTLRILIAKLNNEAKLRSSSNDNTIFSPWRAAQSTEAKNQTMNKAGNNKERNVTYLNKKKYTGGDDDDDDASYNRRNALSRHFAGDWTDARQIPCRSDFNS